MTFQVPDRFYYNDIKVELQGLRESLITPKDYGIKPKGICSACWRGYLATYVIINNEILLDKLMMRIDESQTLPLFNKVVPIRMTPEMNKDEMGTTIFGFTHMYADLKFKLPTTGTIVLAKSIIPEGYWQTGASGDYLSKIRIQFEFDNGVVKSVEDISDTELKNPNTQDSKPPSNSSKDVDEWIMKRFSLDPRFNKTLD